MFNKGIKEKILNEIYARTEKALKPCMGEMVGQKCWMKVTFYR